MRSMLEGVRFIDFTNTLAGPGCTFLLADMGAEVIKVEKPGLGDKARLFPPYKDGFSASFAALNRGKRGIPLNLKNPRAVEIFKGAGPGIRRSCGELPPGGDEKTRP